MQHAGSICVVFVLCFAVCDCYKYNITFYQKAFCLVLFEFVHMTTNVLAINRIQSNLADF